MKIQIDILNGLDDHRNYLYEEDSWIVQGVDAVTEWLAGHDDAEFYID